jgi:succinate dehydrogenase / fumarate reductase membrane anchor subunit
MLGETHENVITYFARPFPAIVAALTIGVTFLHFKNGAHTMIEDYVHGTSQKLAIIFVTCLSYAAVATGLFAIARIAL